MVQADFAEGPNHSQRPEQQTDENATLLSASLPGCGLPAPSAGNARLNYPAALRDDTIVDNLHGTLVPDPFRPLETASAGRIAWIEAQNLLTRSFIDESPDRARIQERLKELLNYDTEYAPSKIAGQYFFNKQSGLQNFSVLYRKASLDGEAIEVLDPNKLSADGTISLGGTSISRDGKRLAYAISRAGSDWKEIRVREIDSGTDLIDEVRFVKFSGISWDHQGEGFYYSRYPEPVPGEALKAANENHQVFYHKVGTPQSVDRLIYERPDQPKWGFGAEVSEDGDYLFIVGWQGAGFGNAVFYQDLKNQGTVQELYTDFDQRYSIIGSSGKTIYVKTDGDAPCGRVVAIDLDAPQKENWRELVPESSNKLGSAYLMGGKIVASYLKDAHSHIEIYNLDGSRYDEIALPGLGTVSELSGNPNDIEIFYGFTSFDSPVRHYKYDVATKTVTLHRDSSLKVDAGEFITRQAWYESKDGTKVPMFVVHRKDLVMDGSNPVYLYGYGGFNIPLTPNYSSTLRAWLEMGGVYAQPSLRGGSEFGEKWHTAGMLDRKQNVFDDFIAAAEWLVREGYSAPPKIAIGGGSNGGLLVGACMTQRPDLFGAAIPEVGVLDMLRFHKFTIGSAWTSEYGCAENSDHFKFLHAYSPLHNLKEGTHYPATLVMVSDHDDRVVPAHSYKFSARLQECQAGDQPCLLRVETDAGHGAGTPLSKVIDKAADKWAFLKKVLKF